MGHKRTFLAAVEMSVLCQKQKFELEYKVPLHATANLRTPHRHVHIRFY